MNKGKIQCTKQRMFKNLDYSSTTERPFFVCIKAGGNISTKTLDSKVGSHTRYSADANYPNTGDTRSGGGEKKYEERNRHELEHYYDEIIKEIGNSEAIFIFGPGEAKSELRTQMNLTHGLSERVVGVESVDELTDPQIEAKVKEHFRVSPNRTKW